MSAEEYASRRSLELGVRYTELRGRLREARLVRIRWQIAQELRGEPWNLSLPQIGKLIGRHHTTVLHGLRKQAA